ncbi:FAD-dependent oxidoreductase [candidate division WOR-3 bacterium]|nr:FAD-dependent oxidoreductase [candidate division WOR-3 bacterium]
MSTCKPVIIIGAGLAGLAAAYELGEEVLILETREEIGGVARTFSHRGFKYDLGPHVLYFRNQQIKEFVSDILDGEWIKQERRARIVIAGETIDYPVQEGFMRSTALKERYLTEILKASGQRGNTFEETARNLYGEGLAKDFFIPYNKKLWQHPLDEMNNEMMADYLPSFPKDDLRLLVQGKPPGRGANACFFYPTQGGIGTLTRKLAENQRYEVKLSTEVATVNFRERWVETADDSRYRYSHLISTIPLPELVRISFSPECRFTVGNLKSVGMVFVHLALTHPLNNDSHWVYYPQPDVIFHRISIPGNYTNNMTPDSKGSLVAEVSFPSDTAPNIDSITIRVTEDVVKLRIIENPRDIIDTDTKVIRYAYVFPSTQSLELRKELLSKYAHKGIILAGRYALWEYGNMESAIAQGLKAAKHIKETGS